MQKHRDTQLQRSNSPNGSRLRSLGDYSTALGTALILALGAAAGMAPAQGQTLQVLYNFKAQNDGYQPMGQPYVDKNDNVFGTSQYDPPNNDGDVWEVAHDGTFKVLHAFPVSGGDGTLPFSNLAADSTGTMFGVTVEGGNGGGTVFSINSKGNFSVLHTFAVGTNDGCNSYGGAVLDQSGNLYGMTDGCGAYGDGTVWRVNTDGSDTLLHSFTGGTDGKGAFYGNLYRDREGNLFGVAEFGGDQNCGCGVLFEIDTTGNYNVLHTFTGGNDGSYPIGAVLRDRNYIYGIASTGGPNGGDGTLWRYDLATSKFKVLHSFTTTDGSYPMGLACQLKNADKVAPACVEGQNGNKQPVLYGTSPEGGANSEGTLWELDSTGQFHKLWDFGHFNGQYDTDGAEPIQPPFVDAKGNLYGTADAGGPSNAGTVWKFTP